VTKLSRWIGLLTVEQGPFRDETPIFATDNDPFPIRFKVRPDVWLDLDRAIPIHDDLIWSNLSFTRELPHNSIAWTGKVRGTLVRLKDADGVFIARTLTQQVVESKPYPIDEPDRRKIATHTVVRSDKVVSVSVPDDPLPVDELIPAPEAEDRESIRIQALIAHIGHQMGMSISEAFAGETDT
jgi:hypothetical protein